MVFVFSVGGGSLEKNERQNLVRALEYARQVGAQILGLVGRDGGYTAQVADACLVVPTVNPQNVTPHAGASSPSSGICLCRIRWSRWRRPSGRQFVSSAGS
jgi:DNA-binding MurR/RpiR family transcriptional regulator